MKIVYVGETGCSDSDFPLIKSLQEKGVEIYAYFMVNKGNARKGLFNIDLFRKDSIIPLSAYSYFDRYKSYFDMKNIFVVNNYHYSRRYWQYWLMWIKLQYHINKIEPDLIHLTWPLIREQKVLYYLKVKKILTVHDPIPHSGQFNKLNERNRIKAFRNVNGYVLLSSKYKEEFCANYSIDVNRICVNKMGEFDHLTLLRRSSKSSVSPYILYIGQIQPHKGVDLLLEAMLKVHSVYPSVKLVVAGKGNFYFDMKKYEKLNYIEFRNYYIPVEDMVDLLCNSMFAVCPYKDATQSGVVQTAFSIGTPLIVTNTGDMATVVQNGVTGVVIEPNNVDSLVSAINSLIGSPEILEKYKKNISDIWKKKQDWSPIADTYIEFYKKILCVNY